MKFKKIIFVAVTTLLLSITFATPTQAALDQRCFTADQCAQRRVFLGADDPSGGYLARPDICGIGAQGTPGEGEPLGFCLPGNKTVTQIAFGGKTQFLHIGDFIKRLFQIGINIAGILAALMIVVAGFQWVVSGGNAQIIGAAKKRIAGAIIGLVLAVSSFTILNTLNPALVNLRLPEIYLINERGIAAVACENIIPRSKLAFAISQVDHTALLSSENGDIDAELETKLQSAIFDKDPVFIGGYGNQSNSHDDVASCENFYFTSSADLQICRGTDCNPAENSDGPSACVPFDITDRKGGSVINAPNCWNGDLVIHFQVTSFQQDVLSQVPGAGIIADVLEDEWLDLTYENTSPGIMIFPVCKSTESDGTTSHWVGTAKEVCDADCGDRDGVPWVDTWEVPSGGFFPEDNRDFMVQYHNLNTDLDKKWSCFGSGKDTHVGFVLMHDLSFDWEFGDNEMWVGLKNGNEAWAGTWDQLSLKDNMIPINQVGGPDNFNSLFLEAKVTGSIVDKIAEADENDTEAFDDDLEDWCEGIPSRCHILTGQ